MAGSGVNLAITRDGESYNKLQRPSDFLTAGTPPPSRRPAPPDESSSVPASKRKREDEQSHTSFRQKRTNAGTSKETSKPARKLDCGMRMVLPGLNDDDEASEGSADEALAYLRGVRSEASAIPHLLVAQHTPPTQASDDQDDQHHMIYKDGVWVAVEQWTSSDFEEHGSASEMLDVACQDRLNELLLKRFDSFRTELAFSDISLASNSTHVGDEVQSPYCFAKECPKIAAIKCLDERSLFKRLRWATEALGNEETDEISPQLSCWIWTLLASVGDVGTLDSERISNIRDLGYAAGKFGARARRTTCERSLLAGADLIEEGKVRFKEPDDPGHDSQEDQGAEEGDGSMLLAASPASSTPGHVSESDAAMSMSGDENPASHSKDDGDMEQARAHLLAQLGDRLVQAQPLPPKSRSRTKHDPQKMHQQYADSQPAGDLALDVADMNTRATIDMILTVAAERFGQRDLLSHRRRW